MYSFRSSHLIVRIRNAEKLSNHRPDDLDNAIAQSVGVCLGRKRISVNISRCLPEACPEISATSRLYSHSAASKGCRSVVGWSDTMETRDKSEYPDKYNHSPSLRAPVRRRTQKSHLSRLRNNLCCHSVRRQRKYPQASYINASCTNLLYGLPNML